jgi:parallel beta-helix repeat protein
MPWRTTSAAATIEGNQAFNSGVGIIVSAQGSGVRVEHNVVFENRGDGIRVLGAPLLVAGNRAVRNGDDGIEVEQPGARLGHNRADRNRDYGIEAVPGVIDEGGNKASGNGNPAQCLNVECK